MKSKIPDLYARLVALDWVLAIAAAGLAFLVPTSTVQSLTNVGPTVSVGASALGGFFFTAGTFAFSMAYSSRSTTMIYLRTTKPRDYGRTWMSSLAAFIIGAIAALVSAALWPLLPLAAATLTWSALVLMILAVARVFWWLGYTLNGEVADIEIAEAGQTRMPSPAQGR